MFKRYPKPLREAMVKHLVQFLSMNAVEELTGLFSGEISILKDEGFARIKSLHPQWTKQDDEYIRAELLRVFRGKSARSGRKEGNAYRQIVIERAKQHCEICGFYSPYTLEAHHIVAVKNGGHGYPSNLIALCNNCHAVVHKLADVMLESRHPFFWSDALDRLAIWIGTTYSPEKYRVFEAVAREQAWFEGARLVAVPSLREVMALPEDNPFREYIHVALRFAFDKASEAEVLAAADAYADAAEKKLVDLSQLNLDQLGWK